MCQMSFLSCFLKLPWLRSKLVCKGFEEALDVMLKQVWLFGPPEEISEGFQKSVFQYFKEKAATSRRENNSLQGTEGDPKIFKISEDFQNSVFRYFKEKAATSRRENNSLQGTEGGDDWMASEAPKIFKISQDFQNLVFQYFKEKAATSRRENNSLQGTEGDDWMGSEAPKFEQDPAKAILFWHIVTEVSFYLDRDGEDNKKQFAEIVASSEISRRISRYMFYLLVKHPSMVSVGITQVNLQRTADTAYYWSSDASTEKEACETLLTANIGGDQTLLDAISCIKRVEQENKDLKEKWMKLGEIWMDIMGNAAKKCKGREHGQQLRNGGELLTHVWLLMAHFGLTDHFQLSDQHHYANVIAKLVKREKV